MIDAIKITDLGKVYPRSWLNPQFEALKGVSLEVAEGEVFGFIGPNGAGKSTTIKVLTGVMRPTSGRAFLFGVDVADPKSRVGLGYVPENASLPEYLTPFEILEASLILHKIKRPNARAHCLEWLERFGLATVGHKVIKGFSKGMAQRTALANAMVISPRLLILDEPLSGLDPIGRRDVVDILSEYCRSGGTLFFTSHVLHDVERLAHRYGLIHHGRLTAVRSPAELAGLEELVTVRSLGETPVAGMREEAPGRWFIEVPRTSVWDTLRSIENAGHTLIEARPLLSLESAFMRVVRGDS